MAARLAARRGRPAGNPVLRGARRTRRPTRPRPRRRPSCCGRSPTTTSRIAMRPTLSWSDLPGRAVGIYGLGREGEASLRACRVRGIEPVLVDDRPGRRPTGAAGDRGRRARRRCSPATSSSSRQASRATRRRWPRWRRPGWRSSVGWGCGCRRPTGPGSRASPAPRARARRRRSPDICWRDWVFALWSAATSACRRSTRRPAPTSTTGSIEVSSYQALDLAVRPPVVAVTSLHPDHLPWHGGDVGAVLRATSCRCARCPVRT